MTNRNASDLAARLAACAEAVCRHYLPEGRKSGRYWLVGDARGATGQSLFVRLSGPERGKGAAGKWTDAQSREHGDLLDIIRESLGLTDFKDVAEEARRFLSLPQPEQVARPETSRPPANPGSTEAARRLFGMSVAMPDTPVAAYLRERGIEPPGDLPALRFHPACYHRPTGGGPTKRLPAMVAAITDLDGLLTGVHRTWLAPGGAGKAELDTPRRAMGALLGHGVRFGQAADVLAAGEGIETVLSLRMALPVLPAVAALSAGHLSAILFPVGLRRLYVLRDRDPAGEGARERLRARAAAAGIEALTLTPRLGDFNDDLRRYGVEALRARLRLQLHPEDVARHLDGSAANVTQSGAASP
jgi:hypothetical protein